MDSSARIISSILPMVHDSCKAVAINQLATCSVRERVEVRLEVKKTSEHAKLPFRKRDTDAGYDLYSAEEVLLLPGRATLVNTGVIIAAPPGFYYTIEGRSSLWRRGVFPIRGIIDATFLGTTEVSLMNASDEEILIELHDRIAQIILHRQYDANFALVDTFSPEYSYRGAAGWGSSGK